MGKSSKRKKIQSETAGTTQGGGSVYAKTMELTKEEISFLKNQLQQQMSQGYAKIKPKNHPKKSASAAQGMISEVYQTGGPPPMLHSLGIASQNNVYQQVERGSFIAYQHDTVSAANLYIQRQPRPRKLKKVQRKRTGEMRESSQGVSQIYEEEEEGGDRRSLSEDNQSDENHRNTNENYYDQQEMMRTSLKSNFGQNQLYMEKSSSKPLILADSNPYPKQMMNQQNEYHSSASHYDNISSTLQPRSSKVGGSIGKKASAPSSIRKPSQSNMPTMNQNNQISQMLMTSKGGGAIQGLPSVEKSLHHALNVYAKKSIDIGMQQISSSKQQLLTRIQPQLIEQQSPRDLTKTSLLMQKIAVNSKGSNNRIELNSQMIDPRTSTVIKNVHQASKQNLMIVQNDSQLSHHHYNHPGQLEKLTPSIISQLQMSTVSPINGNPNQRFVMALSPKKMNQIPQQKRSTPYSRRLQQIQQITAIEMPINSNIRESQNIYNQQFQTHDQYHSSTNMPQINNHYREISQDSTAAQNLVTSSRTQDVEAMYSKKKTSSSKKKKNQYDSSSSSSSSRSRRSKAVTEDLVSPDFRARAEESIVDVNELMQINGGGRSIEYEEMAGTHKLSPGRKLYKSPINHSNNRPVSDLNFVEKDQQENFFGIAQTTQNHINLSNQKDNLGTTSSSKLGVTFKSRRIKQTNQTETNIEKLPPKPGDSIICQVVSIEPYMKRCMQKLGWNLSIPGGPSSANFHIKYDIADKEGTINKMHSKQWYNHFPNNRELTTKAGLCKNLWHYCLLDYELKIQNFFPRCYDLSDQKNIEQFMNDFQLTAILSIIKQYSEQFMRTTPMIEEYFEEYLTKDNYNENHVFKQVFKFKCSKYDQLRSASGNLLGNDNLRMAMDYIRVNVLNKYHIDSKKMNKRFTEDEMSLLVEFSQQLWETGVQNQKIPLYEQIKTLSMNRKLCKVFPQYAVIDGLANVWVVKPSYNARGVGVYCTNKIKDIIQQGKKSASKIVQKYIERPFLLNQKKFDIRQWVLVTSWEPLDIYVFSSAYLKICGNDFNLRNLADQYSHLSNFSIQKGNKQFGSDDLVMSHEQFEAYVRENMGNKEGFTWETDMRPQINQVVYATLKAAQDAMEQRSCTFEVYGFDLILDEALRPWVIEVNLSPACNERTEWLTKMVDDMSLDLLTHVEQRILMQSDADQDAGDGKERPKRVPNLPPALSLSLNKESFYSDNDLKHRWMRLDECVTEYKNTKITEQATQQIIQKNPQFELVGNKMNTKFERILDKDYKRNKSIALIQRCYRGCKDRKIYRCLQQEKSSIIIQRYLRMNYAQKYVLKLKQEKASLYIQRFLRVKLSLNKIKRMTAEKVLQAQTFVALRLQSHFRRHKAQYYFQNIKLHHSASIIQSYLRKRLSKKEIQQKLSSEACAVRIQRFFKKWLKKKHQMAIYIQKTLRVVKAKRKITKLLRISRGSKKLYDFMMKKKLIQYMRQMIINCKIYTVQKYLRGQIAWRKVKRLKKEIAQMRLRKMFQRVIFQNLKQVAQSYNQIRNQKASMIQNVLKGYRGSQLVKQMKFEKSKHTHATLIQSYLRVFLAKRMVSERAYVFKCLVKIQSFARMVLAKRFVRELIAKKERKEQKKTKKLQKKNSRKSSCRRGSTQNNNKEIENYIESILMKEVNSNREKQSTRQSQRNTKSNVMTTTHTPSHQTGHPPLPRKGSCKDLKEKEPMCTEIFQVSVNQPTIHTQFFNNIDKFTPVTEKNFDRIPLEEEVNGTTIQSYKDARLTVSVTEDLALQRLADVSSINAQDRLQKSLRIRKNQAQKPYIAQIIQADGSLKPPNQIMSNYSEIRHGKSAGNSYQRELNNKVVQAIQKKQQSQSRSGNAPPQISTIMKSKPKFPVTGGGPTGTIASSNEQLPKAKSFAENLMNMLAKQNIGHVFSENPVEALTILKDKPSQGGMKPENRRTSNGIQRNEGGLQNMNAQTITDVGVTLTSKFTQFPKLADFKQVTNNIYLQNRPVADPRQEAEFQQAVQDMRNKQSSFQNLTTHSRAEIQKQIDITQRKSVENLKTLTQMERFGNQQHHQASPPSMTGHFEENLLQRPNNQIIIQAYKKSQHIAGNTIIEQQHPPKIHITAQSLGAGTKTKRPKNEPKQIKSKFSKGNGAMMEFEEGIILPLNSKKGTSTYNTQQSDGKPQQKSMPSIYSDTHTNLMII